MSASLYAASASSLLISARNFTRDLTTADEGALLLLPLLLLSLLLCLLFTSVSFALLPTALARSLRGGNRLGEGDRIELKFAFEVSGLLRGDNISCEDDDRDRWAFTFPFGVSGAFHVGAVMGRSFPPSYLSLRSLHGLLGNLDIGVELLVLCIDRSGTLLLVNQDGCAGRVVFC